MDVLPMPWAVAIRAREEMVRFGVPGMSYGAVFEGRFYAAAEGIANLRTGHPVTIDTLFQTGSTSKTFTATAAMILADEGRLDIEKRVREYLPDFRLREEEDAARVTVRHLLTHHAGWMGDYFKDFGRGDDALALMTASMDRAARIVPPGTAFSYSNAAFNVLARIVEVASGAGFEAFVTERILRPLGMEHTTYRPEEAITFSAALGHVVRDGALVPSRWHIPRSIAGSSGVVSSVVDQLRYLAFHLGDGAAADGSRILREATLREMQRPQAAAGSMCENIGLSWMLDTVGGHTAVKHGGSISGQLSSFEFIPALGYGCTALTNAETGRELRQVVADVCLEHFTGLRREPPTPDPALNRDLAAYAGKYLQRIAELDVTAGPDSLLVVERAPEFMAATQGGGEPSAPARLSFFAPDRAVLMDGPHRGETCEFLRDATGRVDWMRWDGRLSRRIEG